MDLWLGWGGLVKRACFVHIGINQGQVLLTDSLLCAKCLSKGLISVMLFNTAKLLKHIRH